MASGKVPFDADNFMGIFPQHMYKAPVPIRALVPEVNVPPGLDAVVLKCLTKKPEGRYATMDEILADLEKLERGLLPDAVHEMMARSGGFNVRADYFRSSAMPAPVPAEPMRRPKRWPLYAFIAAVGTVVGTIGVVVIAKSSSSKAQTVASSAAVIAPSQPAATATAIPGPVATPVPQVTASPRVAVTREVLVSVLPPDANVSRGGRELGQPPL